MRPLGLFAAASLLLVSCADGLTATDERARDRWSGQQLSSYSYRYVHSGAWCEEQAAIVTVDDDEVTDVVDDGRCDTSLADDAPTIDELFSRIAEARASDADVAVGYDETGVPVRISVDDPDIEDDEITIRVEDLAPAD